MAFPAKATRYALKALQMGMPFTYYCHMTEVVRFLYLKTVRRKRTHTTINAATTTTATTCLHLEASDPHSVCPGNPSRVVDSFSVWV